MKAWFKILEKMTPTKNPVPILSDRVSWSSTVGNFILNFGMLDLHVQAFEEFHRLAGFQNELTITIQGPKSGLPGQNTKP